MANEKKLLAVRKQIKSRKPTFKRSQVNQFAKLKNTNAWRKPKGMGNKLRRGRRGQPMSPTCGFGSPVAIRGFNKAGFKEVIVNNVAELVNIDTKLEVAVISATVGGKKKLAILEKAKADKISISNVKDIDVQIKALTKTKKVTETKKVETKKIETKKKEETKK